MEIHEMDVKKKPPRHDAKGAFYWLATRRARDMPRLYPGSRPV